MALPAVFCADIGSISSNNFAWFGLLPDSGCLSKAVSGTDISELCDSLTMALTEFGCVSLGFECPLFIPVPHNPNKLGNKREIEDMAWSAGPGVAALGTGLCQTAWIFSNLFERFTNSLAVTFDFDKLFLSSPTLHIWEAYVTNKTGKQKKLKNFQNQHVADAEAAVRSFASFLSNPDLASAIDSSNTPVFSLVGAALLRSGLTSDTGFLKKTCLLIKGKP